MSFTVTVGTSNTVAAERISIQIPSASATPWPSNTRTRSILSGSGGGPTINTHIIPSAIAIEYLCLTSAASSANNHNIGPVTYADGATGLRKAARFSNASQAITCKRLLGDAILALQA